MPKPIKHPSFSNEDYYVDLISDDPNVPPSKVQTHLRHLLLAVELGDLVLVQCIRSIDNSSAYVICASVVDAANKRRLLPICELEDTMELLSRYRPPVAAENAFVNAQHTGHYAVCLLANPEEVALAEVRGEDTNVH